MIEFLSFPVASRERAQIRLTAAVQHAGRYPERLLLGVADYKNLRRNMEARHGYQNKPLDILGIPVVEDVETPDRQIGFEWSE